ncbi:MAG: hypothetical protein ACK53K_10495 [Burkholderiales bacterium]
MILHPQLQTLGEWHKALGFELPRTLNLSGLRAQGQARKLGQTPEWGLFSGGLLADRLG